MDAVILAAGRGTRLAPLTDNIPKPLIRLNNKPILEYIIQDLSSKGVKRIYFIVGYLKEKIIEYVNSIREKYKIEPFFIVQRKLMGTAHAVSLLPQTISSTFLLVTGDTILKGAPVKKFILKNKSMILVKKVSGAKRMGIIETKGKKIISCVYNHEKTFDKKVYVDIGMMSLPKEIISYAKKEKYEKEVYLAQIIDKMIQNKFTFYIDEWGGEQYHITSIEDINKISLKLKHNKKKQETY